MKTANEEALEAQIYHEVVRCLRVAPRRSRVLGKGRNARSIPPSYLDEIREQILISFFLLQYVIETK